MYGSHPMPAGGAISLRRMLEGTLMSDIPNAHLMSDIEFEMAARGQLDMLQTTQQEMTAHNLRRRGFAVKGAPSEVDAVGEAFSNLKPDAAVSPTKPSDLTTAVSNANRVFDLLLQRRGKGDEKLEQWDVLSGIMEDATIRKLTALEGEELPNVYALVDRLFRGKDAGQAGGGDGKDIPAAEPVDREKFERFFIVRHLGLLDAFEQGSDKPAEAPAGGNIAQVRWQEMEETVTTRKVRVGYGVADGTAPAPAAQGEAHAADPSGHAFNTLNRLDPTFPPMPPEGVPGQGAYPPLPPPGGVPGQHYPDPTAYYPPGAPPGWGPPPGGYGYHPGQYGHAPGVGPNMPGGYGRTS